jgi:hypothetical protein
MKILRPALIVAILCCFASGAVFAQASKSHIHVVFDPPPPVFVDPNNVFTAVTPGSGPVSFAWGACDAADNPFAPPSIQGDDACANFANISLKDALTFLSFTFIADSSIANSVDCTSIDPALSNAFCPDGPTQDGLPVIITFSGGTAIPPSGSKTNLSVFFLAETGVAPADINKLSWTVAASEPTSIHLLAAGMGLIGLLMVFTKR